MENMEICREMEKVGSGNINCNGERGNMQRNGESGQREYKLQQGERGNMQRNAES